MGGVLLILVWSFIVFLTPFALVALADAFRDVFRRY